MSDKPKIYAFCPANCKWETVHKEDFNKAITYIKQAPVDDIYDLEPIALYKIFSYHKSNNTKYSYVCQLHYVDSSISVCATLTTSEHDVYRDYVYFEILSLSVNDGGTKLTIVYEVNGNRYETSVDGTYIDISKAYLKVINATDVYKYNPDANITATVSDPPIEINVNVEFTAEDIANKVVWKSEIGSIEDGVKIYRSVNKKGLPQRAIVNFNSNWGGYVIECNPFAYDTQCGYNLNLVVFYAQSYLAYIRGCIYVDNDNAPINGHFIIDSNSE